MWYKEMKSISEGLLNGDDYYNWDSAAGINYVVDVRKPAGDKVNIKTNADGSKFDRDATYTVVLNAFRANDMGGYISEGLGMSMREAQSRVKSAITIDLEKGYEMGERMLGTIEPVYTENWFASPIIWAQRGMEADMERMK
jgi:2',3'-cyclic-nucleotide 2'-phosphodiesterase/3'-nucleotidase